MSQEQEQEYPSLPEQASNLAKFSFNVVRAALTSDDALVVSEEIRDQRMNVCKSCEYYDSRQVRCRHCGCFLETKIRFAIDSCPLQKWSFTDQDWMNDGYQKILKRIENNQLDFASDDVRGPRFPLEAVIGEIYKYQDENNDELTWQYDGKVWRLID